MPNRPSLLMIPGPIEFTPGVLNALGTATLSHVDKGFIDEFGNALERMREVWRAPAGQPFVVAGSGTLAMDMAGANLVEPGDRVLVVSTGVFGDRYADLLARYGARVEALRAEPGRLVDLAEVERTLQHGTFKLMAFTHVDTSTGVRVDPRPMGRLGHEYGVLTVLDGVCSLAGERLEQEAWGIDVALTASQKAIGVPPGLALLVASERAIAAWRARKSPVMNYYVDWSNWLPIMQAYEERRGSYFATPPVNLIRALGVSLGEILEEGMEPRFRRHETIGAACREAIAALNLGMVPADPSTAASTLTCPRYPAGVSGSELLPAILAKGVVVAGGLHPAIRSEYFRIGHMGAVTPGDLLVTIGAIERAMVACEALDRPGAGLAAAQAVLQGI